MIQIDPAGLDPGVKAVGGLRIDVASVQNQAAERRLDVSARTAESIVEVEMAEGGVEIVAPQQADHAAAEPHTFGIARRPVERLLRFGKLVDLLRLLAGFLARRASRRGRLVRRFGVVVLGKSGRRERNDRSREEPKRRAQPAGKGEQTMQHGSTLLGRFSNREEGRFPGHRIGPPLRHLPGAAAMTTAQLRCFVQRRIAAARSTLA